MFIVGIDVAKRSHEVCMITSDGQTVQRPFSIRNNCTGYNLMLEKIRKHTNIKSQIVFAMESTAHYWLALFTRLRDVYKRQLYRPSFIGLSENAGGSARSTGRGNAV